MKKNSNNAKKSVEKPKKKMFALALFSLLHHNNGLVINIGWFSLLEISLHSIAFELDFDLDFDD